MTNVRLKLVVGAGLALGAVAIVVTLAQAPITVARINSSQNTFIAGFQERTSICQSGETLPRQTSAIRLRAYAFLGPRVTVGVLADGRLIAHGERGAGWTGGVVTVPVNRLSTARSGVELCFTLYLNGNENSGLSGEPTREAQAARDQAGPLPGRIRVEYLRPARSSWWSIGPEVARRMGLGRAWSGSWNALLVLVLMGSLVALCSRMILRELR